MSTVDSLNTYWDIRGIQPDVVFLQGDDWQNTCDGYVSQEVIDSYGSGFAYILDGEVRNIWGCERYTPWNNAYCEHIYSARAFHRRIARRNARRLARIKAERRDRIARMWKNITRAYIFWHTHSVNYPESYRQY